jgi:DNA-binding protein H-NS
MAHTYLEIKAQIHKLQEEAAKLRHVERAQVIAKIKVAIATFDLTPAELFANKRPSAKSTSVLKSKIGSTPSLTDAFENMVGREKSKPLKLSGKKPGQRSVAIKYRDGSNAWSGRGSKPKWLAAAIASGKKIEQFQV